MADEATDLPNALFTEHQHKKDTGGDNCDDVQNDHAREEITFTVVNTTDEHLPSNENSSPPGSVLDEAPSDGPPKIELNAVFQSFLQLRKSLDNYQRENRVQLVVKDSKLLSAESTKRILPNVYHKVNQNLMYHSITYCCKCHGVLKQKPGSRIKKIGAKRLNCPMYVRFKLSSDFQSLVLFDLLEKHNHPVDPNTFYISPRQQVYRMSHIKRGLPDPLRPKMEAVVESEAFGHDVHNLITSAIKEVNSISSLNNAESDPPPKRRRKGKADESTTQQSHNNAADATKTQTQTDSKPRDNENGNNAEEEEEEDEDDEVLYDNPNSPLDPESSCSDSEEEEFQRQRHLLSFPVRLIGSAVQSSPQLLALAKDLMEAQKDNLAVAKRKMLLETRRLELENAKLSLEVRSLEKTLASSSSDQTTTVYLHS